MSFPIQCPECRQILEIYVDGLPTDANCGWCKCGLKIHDRDNIEVLIPAHPKRLEWLRQMVAEGRTNPLPSEPDAFYQKRVQLARESGGLVADANDQVAQSPLVAPSVQQLVEQRKQASVASASPPRAATVESGTGAPIKPPPTSVEQQPAPTSESPKPRKGSLWATGSKAEPDEQPSPAAESGKLMRLYDAARVMPMKISVDSLILIGQQAKILPPGEPGKLRLSTVSPEELGRLRGAVQAASVAETLGRPPPTAQDFFGDNQQHNEQQLERGEP